jgi:DNA modification methylase
MIQLSSREGDIMLTPFSGAGSECLAAKELGRNYLGYEVDPQYVDIAHKRLENAMINNQINIFDSINKGEE